MERQGVWSADVLGKHGTILGFAVFDSREEAEIYAKGLRMGLRYGREQHGEMTVGTRQWLAVNKEGEKAR